jgi:2-hydroxychromene-2-carboxylate isomerase
MADEIKTAEFWFDPLCPWAWITSRWMHEVEKVRPVRTKWNIMSLAYLNLVQHGEKDMKDEYRELMKKAWGPVRICAAAAAEKGDEILGPLYTAIGIRWHNEKRQDPEALGEALEEVGLSPDLLKAADSTEFDAAIIESHKRGIDLVGMDVGTPIVTFDGNAFFGPVVTPSPTGEAAGKLWDGVVLVAGTDGFFELKRTRDRSPSFD